MTHNKFLCAEKALDIVKILIINLFLTLVGCTVSTQISTSQDVGPSSLSTIIVSRVLPTSTPLLETQSPLTMSSTAIMPTVTITVPPTTPTITTTPKSTNTETPIPISTPPGVVRREQVLWLLETNNGCQLPCWWGITPGETEWTIAKEFLNRFDQNIYQASSTPGQVYYEVSIPLPFEVFTEDYTELGILVQNGFVEIIETDVSIGDTPPGHLTPYILSAILMTYGEPAEVWIATYGSSPGGGPGSGEILPFVVVLFYRELGIATLYYDNGVIQGGVVHGCPQEDPAKTLSLWSPDLDLTFEEVVNGSSAFNYEYLSLEESTEMDVVTFYETFKNADNTTCLETPADLWH